MVKVTVLRGLPGAGKSTFLLQLPQAQVVSADRYLVDADGIYRFHVSRLPEANARCLRAYVAALLVGRPHLVVDNANISVVDLAPYCALALAHGYDLEIVTLQIEPEVAAARCGRSISVACMRRMGERLDRATKDLPPDWPHRVVSWFEREGAVARPALRLAAFS